jgi:hypothetical protein
VVVPALVELGGARWRRVQYDRDAAEDATVWAEHAPRLSGLREMSDFHFPHTARSVCGLSAALRALSELRRLFLVGLPLRIEDVPWAALSHLRTLEFHSTTPRRGPPCLMDVVRGKVELRVVRLAYDGPFDMRDITDMLEACPQLRVLDVGPNECAPAACVTLDEVTRAVARAPRLQMLELGARCTQFTGRPLQLRPNVVVALRDARVDETQGGEPPPCEPPWGTHTILAGTIDALSLRSWKTRSFKWVLDDE